MALTIRVHESTQAQGIDPDKVVQDILNENECYYDWSWDIKTGNLRVEVSDGDWKHDHLFLDYIMEKAGFEKVAENQYGGPTGGDWYSSTHIYEPPQEIQEVIKC